MTQITYTKSELPIREDFVATHNRFWNRLSKAGSWFTAEDRIAIAGEVRKARDCALCKERKEALSPMQVKGVHDSNSSGLSDLIVDTVHRIVSDPGRLTRTWFDQVINSGLSEEQYVEILSTASAMIGIDDFCLGLGIDEHPLPEATAGEPSKYRPSTAVSGDAWVSTIPNGKNSGKEADLWSGRAVNVKRAMSLVPDEVRTLSDLMNAHFMPSEDMLNFIGSPRGTLSRQQMEVMATRASALNGCFY